MNEILTESEDSVAWRKRVSCVTPKIMEVKIQEDKMHCNS